MPCKDLWLIDRKFERVVEPGDFEIMLGSSSEDIRLTGTLTVIGKRHKVADSLVLNNNF